MKKYILGTLFISLFLFSCENENIATEVVTNSQPSNVLDYTGMPSSPYDRTSLAFSDQGAWFAYGLPNSEHGKLGFTGPFLMTQGQGEWCSPILSELTLQTLAGTSILESGDFQINQASYNSHLEQTIENNALKISQSLFFNSAHSVIITTQITNQSEEKIILIPSWEGTIFDTELNLNKHKNSIELTTDRSTANGTIQTMNSTVKRILANDSTYSILLENLEIAPNTTETITLAHTFIFEQYDAAKEQQDLLLAAKEPLTHLQERINEKQQQLEQLNAELGDNWKDSTYQDLVAKTALTLQNNTRVAAGELKHAGVFPSYHYKWFLGFWAWDSWKHAVAISHYDPELAKNQIRAMYDFQLANGFIVDCVYRDTLIENHNYRNTKPPLSAWAIWEIYEQDQDIDFIKEIYPKVVKQHNWWYAYRDFDKDSLCEYGSTDGTLVAAKWESGMDNAVRFDESQMVKSAQTVYSLDQESVDLNAYLYAEKIYLAKMANALSKANESKNLEAEASVLKAKIQDQFYDKESGWFYDTSIDGTTIIPVMGCEGWIPLWANVASTEQAEAVKNNMMDPSHFNTKVPFQTLDASHPKFKPNRGYWRGPNWLDQAYFGVVGLRNYDFLDESKEATYKLIHNAEGVATKGSSIRENYQPITGEGLESQNFSWSAAHYLLLILEE